MDLTLSRRPDGVYTFVNDSKPVINPCFVGGVPVSPELVGFSVWETGGGFTAWGKEFAGGIQLMVTAANESSHRVDGSGACLVGVFQARSGEPLVEYEFGAFATEPQTVFRQQGQSSPELELNSDGTFSFEWEGVAIVNPATSSCGRFSVSPAEYGFTVQGTGGNCTAWRRDFGPLVMLVTNRDEASHELHNGACRIGVSDQAGHIVGYVFQFNEAEASEIVRFRQK